MPESSPGMTGYFVRAGVLKRRCAIGKPGSVGHDRMLALNVTTARFRGKPHAFLILRSRACAASRRMSSCRNFMVRDGASAPPHHEENQLPLYELYPWSSQYPPLYSLVTSIETTYFGFLNPSLVGTLIFIGKP